MFGSGSLEQKLRKEGGRTAPATVLSEKDGIGLVEGGVYGGGTDITRLHFKLRVEPVGEQPFEAEIVIRRDEMRIGQWGVGPNVFVLYDPSDHRRVAFDFDAMIAADPQASRSVGREERLRQVVAAAQAQPAPQPADSSATDGTIDRLQQLADLRDRGVLTDEEFAAQKAKLLG